MQRDIAEIQDWLEEHRQLLHLLDQAMNNVFQLAEARIKRNNLLQNAVFCVLGAVLGQIPWIPTLLHAFIH